MNTLMNVSLNSYFYLSLMSRDKMFALYAAQKETKDREWTQTNAWTRQKWH